MSLWNHRPDLDNFENLDAKSKENVIKVMMDPQYFNQWSYARMLKILIEKIPSKDGLEVFNKFITNDKICYPDFDGIARAFNAMYEKHPVKQDIKDVLYKSPKKTLHKIFLGLDGITKKEEEAGLRSLASSTYSPDFVYTTKYKPRESVLSSLPPVMRLNVLEALLSNTNMSYNMFEGYNPDDFKKMLFGAVLRHRDRVEKVWNRFQEIVFLGQRSVVQIDYVCDNCQDFSITIDSVRIRTETGLLNTSVGQFLNYTRCPLCGRYGNDKVKKTITLTGDQ